MIPGEMKVDSGEIELNAGRRTLTLTVANTGDRPVQVGSHYHFFEINEALSFDRAKARGLRKDKVLTAGELADLERRAWGQNLSLAAQREEDGQGDEPAPGAREDEGLFDGEGLGGRSGHVLSVGDAAARGNRPARQDDTRRRVGEGTRVDRVVQRDAAPILGPTESASLAFDPGGHR